MKNSLLFLIVCLLIISILGGCSKPAPSPESTETTTQTTTTTAETTEEQTEPQTTIPEKCQLYFDIKVEENLMFSTYDIEIDLDGEEIGNVKNGDTFTALIEVGVGEHVADFYKSGDHSIKAEKRFKISTDSTFSCTLSAHKSDIELNDYNLEEALIGNELTMVDVTGKNLKEAISILEEIGFSNVNYESNSDSSIWDKDNWTVIDQNIEPGSSNDKNIEIVLICAKADELNTISDDNETKDTNKEDDNVSLFYSTNNREIAKNGDTGIFAYRSKGGQYYIYIIIDFDDGYVYYFTEGNGSETCERVVIDYGNLNDGVSITYHDGDMTWNEWYSFNFARNPETLLHYDADGLTTKFYGTDLEDALSIRDKKTIIDY